MKRVGCLSTRVSGAAGQPLFLLEADKSANEIEAPATGTLRIIGKAGEIYPVGAVLAKIE
jgi:pyruvate/2-oxoglutarate dehydrogenase complex dihydrolipoamide acyltransferase (E2) component